MQVSATYMLTLVARKQTKKYNFLLTTSSIDSQGAIELAECLEASVLKSLNLSYNKIEKVGLQSILDSLETNIHLQVNNCMDLTNN